MAFLVQTGKLINESKMITIFKNFYKENKQFLTFFEPVQY